MLVLGRKNGEKVIIEDTKTGEVIAEIVLVDSERGKGKIGFIASQQYNIYRQELGALRKQKYAANQRSTTTETTNNDNQQAHNT